MCAVGKGGGEGGGWGGGGGIVGDGCHAMANVVLSRERMGEGAKLERGKGKGGKEEGGTGNGNLVLGFFVRAQRGGIVDRELGLGYLTQKVSMRGS